MDDENHMNDFENLVEESFPAYWYEQRRGRYWHTNESCEWVDKSEVQFRRHLKKRGLNSSPDYKNGEVVSEIDELLENIESNCRVFYAGALAGWQRGIHEMEGERILVSRGPHLLTPKPGYWPVLDKLFSNILSSVDENIDQRKYFFSWLKHTLESLYRGRWSRGLAVALAGEVESGKSLLVDLVKEILGGKCAKPYRYMIHKDGFNEEMFETSLLVVDDESAETDIHSRKHFAAEIKQIVATSSARCRGMHKTAITLKPLWRLMICVNLEPDNLMVLPPIDEDIVDKIMLLKAYRKAMPMPVNTEIEKGIFWDTLMNELPAFVYWLLNEWEIPEQLRGRFGVTPFHHPEIREILEELSPWMRLHHWIERTILKDRNIWSGTATELEQALKAEENSLTYEEKKKIPQNIWIGRYLSKLAQKFGPHRYKENRSKDRREWEIRSVKYPS